MSTPNQLSTNADLRALQRNMAAALMQPLTRHDGMQGRTEVDFITPNDRMSGFQRLEIYARQYWFRLLDCLYDDYPALRVLLGERRFHKLCRDYLATHSSTSWTLRNLGSHLSTFITDPKARDVARVEWAQTLAFDEAWLKPVRPADLVNADMNTLRLGVQPCVVLVETSHAVDHFITTMQKADADVRGSASQAVTSRPTGSVTQRKPALKKGRFHLAIHRHENRLYFKRLPSQAFAMLSALQVGRTLADALGGITAEPEQIRDWFAEFTQLGWLTKKFKAEN